MLQRIYGTAWESDKALKEHLHRLEEAERRDHRKLGAELDLFSFPDEIGSGLAVFHPKGGTVRRIMEEYSPPAPRRGGLRVRQLTAHHEVEPVRGQRAPRLVRRRHVPADGARRGHGLLPQADELPVPHPDLQEPHAVVPRPAAAALRVRDGVPLREVGRRARPHPRAGHDPGRRAHLHAPRSRWSRSSQSLLHFVLDVLRDYGLDDFYLELSTKPPGKAVGTDEEWDEATEALRRGRVGDRPRARDGRGRRRVLRPEDLGAGARRDRADVADVDDPARLPAAAALRPARTSAPTTSGTGRS